MPSLNININAEETFYDGSHKGIDYNLFINEKEFIYFGYFTNLKQDPKENYE